MSANKSDLVSRRAALGALAAIVTASKAAAEVAAPAGAQPISVKAHPINSFAKTSGNRTFGRLTFVGGLQLTSEDKNFGGWSGLAIEPDGRRFLSVSDEGHWMTGELTYAEGRPVGIANAAIAQLLASNGRPVARKRDSDAEAVALLEGNLTRGTALVAYERNHRIARHPIVNGALLAPAGLLRMPAETRQMDANKGLEAMTVMAGGPHKGAVIAFSERLLNVTGMHTGWIWVGGEPRRLNLTQEGGFDITDIASLPDGSLLVLERRFRWTEGVRMQLRLLKPEEVAPNTLARGTILLTADMTHEIDNMEGLSIHRGPKGETVLTMISDDNFNSLLQRTILLQFILT